MTNFNHQVVLPDELVKEVLSPLLKVPDDLFCDTSATSPFAAPSESSSSVLVVCKQWMRVATPLLYHVVVLRSKPQAQALERTLKENGGLGEYIKMLRLEGGYGSSMQKIIVGAPNITHLFLTMDLWSSDNISGLRKALHLMQPRNVYLRSSVEGKLCPKDNSCKSGLLAKLCECIDSEWKTLKTVDFTYGHYDAAIGDNISSALAQSSSLETVLIPYMFSTLHLPTIAKSKSLRRIRVKGLSSETYAPWEEESFARPARQKHHLEQRNAAAKIKGLRALIVYEDPPIDAICTTQIAPLITRTSTDPSYIPMAGAQDAIREAIWTRVIYFATGPNVHPQLTSDSHSEHSQSHRWKRKTFKGVDGNALPLTQNRLSLASVCKEFWRLTEPYLYEDIELANSSILESFQNLLERKPWIAPYIRSVAFVRFHKANFTTFESPQTKYAKSDQALKSILSVAVNLVTAKQFIALAGSLFSDVGQPGHWIPWDVMSAFTSTARAGIASFGRLYCAVPRDRAAFSALHGFTSLVYLEVSVNCDKEKASDAPIFGAIRDPGLPSLETLCYSESASDPKDRRDHRWPMPGLLGALANFKLPRFHTLIIKSGLHDGGGYCDFIKKHGSRIVHAKISHAGDHNPFLRLCPNLKNLTIFGGGSIEAGFFTRDPQPSSVLEKIHITKHPPYFSISNVRADWQKFFMDIDLSAYGSRALKEFCVGECHWPKDEKEILRGKNLWPERSERLAKFDVTLTDSDGKRWIPRLTKVKVKRGALKEGV